MVVPILKLNHDLFPSCIVYDDRNAGVSSKHLEHYLGLYVGANYRPLDITKHVTISQFLERNSHELTCTPATLVQHPTYGKSKRSTM